MLPRHVPSTVQHDRSTVSHCRWPVLVDTARGCAEYLGELVLPEHGLLYLDGVTTHTTHVVPLNGMAGRFSQLPSRPHCVRLMREVRLLMIQCEGWPHPTAETRGRLRGSRQLTHVSHSHPGLLLLAWCARHSMHIGYATIRSEAQPCLSSNQPGAISSSWRG